MTLRDKKEGRNRKVKKKSGRENPLILADLFNNKRFFFIPANTQPSCKRKPNINRQRRKSRLEESQAPYNEPASASSEKKIIFFNSFEEENEYTHGIYAAMTPEERLAQVTIMRLTAYPFLNTNTDPWGKTIFFD